MLTSEAKELALIAGIGTGKSYTLALTIIQAIASKPDIKILLVANTHAQLVNASVSTLLQTLDMFNIKYETAFQTKQIRIGKAIVYVYSLEKPDNIRGIEVGMLLGDEVAFATKEAIDICIGRLRQKNSPRQIRYFSSPNGFNYLYDKFNGTKNLISASTLDNTFLPEDYICNLIESYGGVDNPLCQQEVFGKFVNLKANAVYFAFKREKHLQQLTPDATPLFVGVDFNSGNMNALIAQYVNNNLRIIDSIRLSDHQANTFSLASTIVNHPLLKNKLYYAICDSTGNSRKSSSNKTDIQILKEHGINVIPFTNPLIKYRQNAVNKLFLQDRLIINDTPNNKLLTKELETLSHAEEEGKVAHQSVILGYLAWHLAPIQKPQQFSKTIQL
jgi:hypothetical protein